MKLNKSVILGFLILIGIFYLLNTLFHRKRKKFNYSIIEGGPASRAEQASQNVYGDGNNVEATDKAQNESEEKKRMLTELTSTLRDDNAVEGKNKPGDVKEITHHDDGKNFKITEIKYKEAPKNPTAEQRKLCKRQHETYIKTDGQVKSGKKKDLCLKLDHQCGICYDKNNHKIEILPTGGGDVDIDGKCNPDIGKIWNNLSKDSTGGKCTKLLDRQSCSNVSSCYELNNNVDISNCAWCPMKGKAYVYDKEKLEKGNTKGQYHPKYPKDDTCEYPEKFPWIGWTNTPLLKTQKQCNKIYADHQCFNSKDPKTGKKLLKFKNTPGCKKQMWTDYGFYGNYNSHKNNMLAKGGKTRDEMLKIDKELGKSKKFSSMLNTMKEITERGKETTIESFIEGNKNKKASSDARYADAAVMGPILYNKNEYPCKWYEMKKKEEPDLKIPHECKLKKWNQSKCGEKGLYHPKNINQNTDFLLNPSEPYIVKSEETYCDATNSMKKVSKEDCRTFAEKTNESKNMSETNLNYLPHGCIYYEDPSNPTDNRILWNENINYNPTTKKEINKLKYTRNDICRSSRKTCYREGATRVCQSISKDDIDKLSPAELGAYYKSIHNKANKNNRPNINVMKYPDQTDKDIYWQKACYGEIQNNTKKNISKNKQCMNDYRFKLKSFDVDNLYDKNENDIGMKVNDVHIKENFNTSNPIYTKNSFKLNTMNKDNEITRNMYGKGGGVRMFNMDVNDYPYWKLDKKVNEFWKTENGWLIFKKLMQELSKYHNSGDIITEEENMIIIDNKVINLANIFRDYNIPKPTPFKKTGNFWCRNNRGGYLKSIKINNNSDKKKYIKKAYDFCKNHPKYNKSFTYFDLDRYRRWISYDYYRCGNKTASECDQSFGYGIVNHYDMGTSGLMSVDPKKNYITKSSYFNGYKKPGDTEFSSFPFHAFMEIIRQKVPKEKVNEIMNLKLAKSKAHVRVSGRYGNKNERLTCDSNAEPIVMTTSKRYRTNSNCGAKDKCIVKLNNNCDVSVRLLDRCKSSQNRYNWSKYGSQVSADGCNAKSKIIY